MNHIITTKQIVLLSLMAFAFSFLMRLIWVYQFNGYEPYIFNSQFMIGTNDGYFWAEGARDILGNTSEVNYNSPINLAMSQITALIARVLPFSFETVIFYMSAFFGSLIVIPLILIGKVLGKIEVGFIAALIASIAWSYYNRTMVGYFDTDMLNIVLPTFLLWSLIAGLNLREDRYILFSVLIIVLYRWWYPQSYSLELAFFIIVAFYTGYRYFKQKEDISFELILSGFMLLAMMSVDDIVKFFTIVILYAIYKAGYLKKYSIYFLLFAFLAFLLAGGFEPIIGKIKGYILKDQSSVSGDILSLHFYRVVQTIKEAGSIPFELFASRISGHTIAFLFSFIGYIWLSFKHKSMLLALPLVGLGFLAYSSGLRFTIYTVPPMALGAGYLIYMVSNLSVKPKNYIFMGLLTTLALAPNIAHIIDYKTPTVFNKNEVEVLDKMKSIASREDYILSWWDYGYPIRYYSDVKTIIDGGIHGGKNNYPFSYAMKSSQEIASNVLRADVEYEEKRLEKFSKFKEEIESKEINLDSNIAQMILESGFKDANDFLAYVESGGEIKMPPKSREIYLFLPNDMLSIFPTISKFSKIDLMSGKMGKEPFFFMTRFMQDRGNYIDLGRGVAFDKSGKYVLIGDTKIPLKHFITTKYDKDMHLQISVDSIGEDGELYAIFMSDYRQLLLLDEEMFNSTFIQLFVLEKYDEKYFQPVIVTPFAKVYKVMR
ncbi:MAG: peptide transporter [Campylobacterales bacterium]|nr:peptide transporter [Campylobacterales bacterium]